MLSQAGDARRVREQTNIAKFKLALLLILGVVLAYFLLLIALEAPQREFFNDKYFGGVGTLFSALAFAGIIYTVLLQKVGLDETLREFEATNQALHYGELDKMYFDLLKMAVDNPRLRAQVPMAERSGEHCDYDTYAYMVWNFVETVADRLRLAQEPGDGGAQPREPAPADGGPGIANLRETWQAAIEVEMRIHAEWWRHNGWRGGFKRAFAEFVERHLPEPVAAGIAQARQAARPPPAARGSQGEPAAL
jgi:hypothetical protein